MSQPATSVIIRTATPEDAPAIAALYQDLARDPDVRVMPGQIAAISISPSAFLLVAVADGTVCGTVLLNVCLDAMYGTQPFGVIENIIVAGAMRGLGIGRLLLEEVERLATRHDCTKLLLSSATTREAAHAFFRHCGFSGDAKRAFVKYRSRFAG